MTGRTEQLTKYDRQLEQLRMVRRFYAGPEPGSVRVTYKDDSKRPRTGAGRQQAVTDTALQASRVIDVDEPPMTITLAPEPQRQPKPKVDVPHIVRTGSRVAYIDLDGVICDDRHRVHHALARDWGSYFGLMTDDVPWRQGRDLYESAIMTGWDVAYLTGRREDTRSWTVAWLQKHGFDHTLPLVMRPEEQRMPLANLKALIVEETLRFVPEVLLYDDDPEVIAAVNNVQGAQAVHCTWHKKEKALVKKALF